MKQKQADTNIPIFNPKSITSTSLPLITKQIPLSTIIITFLPFLQIEEISDSDNNSVDMKNPEKPEKKALNLEAYTMITHTRPLAIE